MKLNLYKLLSLKNDVNAVAKGKVVKRVITKKKIKLAKKLFKW